MDPVGDFYVHLVHRQKVDSEMTSSTKLLCMTGMPSVIHFYDGGCGGCRPCAAQMELWAKAYKNQAQFLCVCVESQRVALEFAHMFRFEHVVNCYIPSREYMPRGFGQLGCSGFIMADKRGNFVSRKTKAYLQYGDYAFRHVEQLLSTQIRQSKPFLPESMLSVAAPEEKKTSKVSPPLASVGVQSMDEEHRRCAKAFEDLLATPTKDALLVVLNELEAHFEHEEVLMKEYRFGGSSDNFSAFSSHVSDHQRILDIGRQELERLSSAPRPICGPESSSCHRPAVVPKFDPKVTMAISEAFHVHAGRFDALYAGRIPEMAH